MSDLERWDAVVSDAIEMTMRWYFPAPSFDPVRLRIACEQAAKRAREDLEEVAGSVREIREAADA